MPKQTIPDVFADVERERCGYGVVPIENSTEGVVNHTLDAFMGSSLSFVLRYSYRSVIIS